MGTERYRTASRVDERHEIRLANGQWIRVTNAMTMSTMAGRLKVRMFSWDGGQSGILPSDQIMSRLAPKEDQS